MAYGQCQPKLLSSFLPHPQVSFLSIHRAGETSSLCSLCLPTIFNASKKKESWYSVVDHQSSLSQCPPGKTGTEAELAEREQKDAYMLLARARNGAFSLFHLHNLLQPLWLWYLDYMN